MKDLKEYIIEGIFDIEDNENNLDKKMDLYKNAINIFKHKVFHPNTLSSFCMEMDSDSTDDDIMNYLNQMEDSEYFDFFKVLYEVSFDIDWYHTFMPSFWLSDIDEEEIYSICERQKTYKKMTDQQYDLLMELGMWRIPDYKNIEEWILIEDKDFSNQHWVVYIKKGMKPIHKRIVKEIIKGYERKLKVKI